VLYSFDQVRHSRALSAAACFAMRAKELFRRFPAVRGIIQENTRHG